MAKAILFGILKKVEGAKGGITLVGSEMKLDSGSVKELFKHVQSEKKIRMSVEPVQEEMFDELPEPVGDEETDDPDLFENDKNDPGEESEDGSDDNG